MRTALQDLQRAVQAGTYHIARQCFLELLDEPDAPLSQVFYEMSMAEYQQGNLRAALTFAEAGEKLLAGQRNPDSTLLLRFRNNLVNLYREFGDVSRAITVGLKWLDDIGPEAPATQRGPVYYNLALAYRQRGGPHDKVEALHYYDMAHSQFEAVGLSSSDDGQRDRYRLFEVMALQNQAWLHCELGNVDEAAECAGAAAKKLSPAFREQQREQVLLAAYIAYFKGDLTGCENLLSDLQESADKATPRQQFWSEWLAARLSLLKSNQMLAVVHSTLAGAEADRTKDVYLMRLAAELDKEVKAAV